METREYAIKIWNKCKTFEANQDSQAIILIICDIYKSDILGLGNEPWIIASLIPYLRKIMCKHLDGRYSSRNWDLSFSKVLYQCIFPNFVEASWERQCKHLLINDLNNTPPFDGSQGFVWKILGDLKEIIEDISLNDSTAVQRKLWRISPICPLINIFDDLGWTLMHHAVFHSSIDVISILVSEGLSLNVTNKELRTPLHIACSSLHFDCIEKLVKSGSLITAKDRSGDIPLLSLLKSARKSPWKKYMNQFELCEAIKLLLPDSHNLLDFASDNTQVGGEEYDTEDSLGHIFRCCYPKPTVAFTPLLHVLHLVNDNSLLLSMLKTLPDDLCKNISSLVVVRPLIAAAIHKKNSHLLRNLLDIFSYILKEQSEPERYSNLHLNLQDINSSNSNELVRSKLYFLEYCLCMVAQIGDSQIAAILLESWSSLNDNKFFELTPRRPIFPFLFFAVLKGDVDLVQSLLPTNIPCFYSLLIPPAKHPAHKDKDKDKDRDIDSIYRAGIWPRLSMPDSHDWDSHRIFSPLSVACLLGHSSIVSAILTSLISSLSSSCSSTSSDDEAPLTSAHCLSEGVNPLVSCVLSGSVDCLLLLKAHMNAKEFIKACNSKDAFGFSPLPVLLQTLHHNRQHRLSGLSGSKTRSLLDILYPVHCMHLNHSMHSKEIPVAAPGHQSVDPSSVLTPSPPHRDIDQLRIRLISIRRSLNDTFRQRFNTVVKFPPENASIPDLNVDAKSAGRSSGGSSGVAGQRYWEPALPPAAELRHSLKVSRSLVDSKSRRWSQLSVKVQHASFGPNVRLLGKAVNPDRRWMVLAKCVGMILELPPPPLAQPLVAGEVKQSLGSGSGKVSVEDWWSKLKTRMGGRMSKGKAGRMAQDMLAWEHSFLSEPLWRELKSIFGPDGEAAGRATIFQCRETREISALRCIFGWVSAVIEDATSLYDNQSTITSELYEIAKRQIEEYRLRLFLSHDQFNGASRGSGWSFLECLLHGGDTSVEEESNLFKLHKCCYHLNTNIRALGLVAVDDSPGNCMRSQSFGEWDATTPTAASSTTTAVITGRTSSSSTEEDGFRGSEYTSQQHMVSDQVAMYWIEHQDSDIVKSHRDIHGHPLLLQLCRSGLWMAAMAYVSRYSKESVSSAASASASAANPKYNQLSRFNMLWENGALAYCQTNSNKRKWQTQFGHSIIRQSFSVSLDWLAVDLPAVRELSPVDIAVVANRPDFISLFLKVFPSAYISPSCISLCVTAENPALSRLLLGATGFSHSFLDKCHSITNDDFDSVLESFRRHSGRWLAVTGSQVSFARKLHQITKETITKCDMIRRSQDSYCSSSAMEVMSNIAIQREGGLSGLCLFKGASSLSSSGQDDAQVMLLDGSMISLSHYREDIGLLGGTLPPPLSARGALATGRGLLHGATEIGDLEMTEYILLDRNRPLSSLSLSLSLDVSGATPIYHALETGDFDLAELLLKSISPYQVLSSNDSPVESPSTVPYPLTEYFSTDSSHNKGLLLDNFESFGFNNMFSRSTVSPTPVDVRYLFHTVAVSRVNEALEVYHSGRNGTNSLETLLLTCFDHIQVLWSEICSNYVGLTKLLEYLYATHGCVLDSLMVVQRILGAMNIPFSGLRSNGSKSSSLQHQKFTDLTPSKLKGLVSWEKYSELLEIVRAWLRSHCSRSEVNTLHESLLLLHCPHISMIAIGELEVAYSGKKSSPSLSSPTGDNAPVSTSLTSKHAHAMLAASPTAAAMFAVPPFVVEETKVVYRSAGRQVSAAQRMAAFLESWKADSEGILEGLRLAYTIIDFTRILCLGRLLVSLSHSSIDSSPGQNTFKRDSTQTSDTAIDRIGDMHPIERRLYSLQQAQAKEENVRLVLDRLGASSQQGLTSSTSHQPRQDGFTSSYGVYTRLCMMDSIAPDSLQRFLGITSSLSARFAGIRCVLLECLALLFRSLDLSVECIWVCQLAKYLNYDQDIFSFLGKGFDSELSSQNQQQGSNNFIPESNEILNKLKNLCVGDIVLAATTAECSDNSANTDDSSGESTWRKVRGMHEASCSNPNPPAAFEYLSELSVLIRSLSVSQENNADSSHPTSAATARRKLHMTQAESEEFLKHQRSVGMDRKYASSNVQASGRATGSPLRSYGKGSATTDMQTYTTEQELQNAYEVADSLTSLLLSVATIVQYRQLYLSDPQLWLGQRFLNPLVACCISSAVLPVVQKKLKKGTGLPTLDFSPLKPSQPKLHITPKQGNAVKNDHNLKVKICQSLLRIGVSVLKVDSLGRMAVVVAALSGQGEILQLLTKGISHRQLGTAIKESTGLLDTLVWNVLMACPPPGRCHVAALFPRSGDNRTEMDPSPAIEMTDRSSKGMQVERLRCGFELCLKTLISMNLPITAPSNAHWTCLDICALKQLDAVLPLLLEKHSIEEQSRNLALGNKGRSQLRGVHCAAMGPYISESNFSRLLSALYPSDRSSTANLLSLGSPIPVRSLLQCDVLTHSTYMARSFVSVAESQSQSPDLKAKKETTDQFSVNFLNERFLLSTVVSIAQSLVMLIPTGHRPDCPLFKSLTAASLSLLAASAQGVGTNARGGARESMTAAGSAVDDTGSNTWSLLHLAVASGNDKKYLTALHRLTPTSASSTSTSSFSYLTELEACTTPLIHLSCYYGMRIAVESLSNDEIKSKMTSVAAFHCEHNELAVFRPVSGSSVLPVTVAIKRGAISCVEILLLRGSQATAEQIIDCTRHGYGGDKLCYILMQNIASVSKNSKDFDSLLFSNTKSVHNNNINSDGSLLHVLCRRGWCNSAKLLVELGADVSVKDSQGLTAIQCSIKCGHRETTRVLSSFFHEESVAGYLLGWGMRVFLSRRYKYRKDDIKVIDAFYSKYLTTS